MIVVETHKQHVRVGVIQSLGVGITTIGVEMVIALNIDVVKKEVLIRSTTKLGSGLGGVSTVRNLSRSSALPIATTKVVGIPQMVFTNPITTTHVNKTIDRPLMSSMAIGGCRSVDVMHSRGGYEEPIVVTAPILDHRDGHYVRPTRVAIKYLDFKIDVNFDAHVRMFNFVIKANAETSKEYIVNAFSYTLRNTTSNWCHNYMSKFPGYTFSEFT
jgi:hypothetical protein